MYRDQLHILNDAKNIFAECRGHVSRLWLAMAGRAINTT